MLVTIGIITGAVVLTSGVLERRYDVLMLADQAEGLTRDTRVMLQGLEVGRVRAVSPHLDSTTSALTFVATLSIRERFPDGTMLTLPRGTRARITRPGLVGNTAVELVMPQNPAMMEPLSPGDTIESQRIATMLDALGGIADEVADDLAATLRQTRDLMAATTGTLSDTRMLIAATTPQVAEIMARLAENLNRTDHILAILEPRVGPITDSVIATLASTRELLDDAQALVSTANDMTIENRVVLAEIMESLGRTAEIFANFADQVSRRPLRMFTGVEPPDTTEERQ